MTLTPEERAAIVEYRMERSRTTFEELEYVIKGSFWNLAANRLYYALFYMCEALLLKNRISTSSHSGVHRMISLHFVKTGKLDKDASALLTDVFRMRQTGDYDDLLDWREEQILPMVPKVKALTEKIEKLIIEE